MGAFNEFSLVRLSEVNTIASPRLPSWSTPCSVIAVVFGPGAAFPLSQYLVGLTIKRGRGVKATSHRQRVLHVVSQFAVEGALDAWAADFVPAIGVDAARYCPPFDAVPGVVPAPRIHPPKSTNTELLISCSQHSRRSQRQSAKNRHGRGGPCRGEMFVRQSGANPIAALALRKLSEPTPPQDHRYTSQTQQRKAGRFGHQDVRTHAVVCQDLSGTSGTVVDAELVNRT